MLFWTMIFIILLASRYRPTNLITMLQLALKKLRQRGREAMTGHYLEALRRVKDKQHPAAHPQIPRDVRRSIALCLVISNQIRTTL